jgi:hypothetical protein
MHLSDVVTGFNDDTARTLATTVMSLTNMLPAVDLRTPERLALHTWKTPVGMIGEAVKTLTFRFVTCLKTQSVEFALSAQT